jgi:hypothetical protein
MPGLDRTGPAGMGPMTGGGRGWCTPSSPLRVGRGLNRSPYPAYRRLPWAFWLGRALWGIGRGFLGRRGWGRGWGRRGRGRGWW